MLVARTHPGLVCRQKHLGGAGGRNIEVRVQFVEVYLQGGCAQRRSQGEGLGSVAERWRREGKRPVKGGAKGVGSEPRRCGTPVGLPVNLVRAVARVLAAPGGKQARHLERLQGAAVAIVSVAPAGGPGAQEFQAAVSGSAGGMDCKEVGEQHGICMHTGRCGGRCGGVGVGVIWLQGRCCCGRDLAASPCGSGGSGARGRSAGRVCDGRDNNNNNVTPEGVGTAAAGSRKRKSSGGREAAKAAKSKDKAGRESDAAQLGEAMPQPLPREPPPGNEKKNGQLGDTQD